MAKCDFDTRNEVFDILRMQNFPSLSHMFWTFLSTSLIHFSHEVNIIHLFFCANWMRCLIVLYQEEAEEGLIYCLFECLSELRSLSLLFYVLKIKFACFTCFFLQTNIFFKPFFNSWIGRKQWTFGYCLLFFRTKIILAVSVKTLLHYQTN